MSDDIVENLKQPAQWIRIAFMIAMAVALYLAGTILTLLIFAQALFGLLTGAANRNLRELGAALTLYVRQLLDFLTYNSEFKPFPFAPFPVVESAPAPAAPSTQDDLDHDVEVHIPEGADLESTAQSQAPAKAPRKRPAAPRSTSSGAAPDGE